MSAGLKKREAVDFAVFSAAALIPALAWIYVPFMSVFAMMVIPVPLALLVRRRDLRHGLAALLIMAAVLSAATASLKLALLLVVQTGPLGLLLGLLFKNHVAYGKSLLAAAFFSLAVALGIFLAGYIFTGASPLVLNERQQYVFEQERRVLNEMFGPGGKAGELDPAALKEMETVIGRVEAAWPVLATSSALIWFMVSASVSYWLARRAMVRIGYGVPASIPFSRWRLPWYVIWGVIAGLALLLGGDQAGARGLAAAGKVVLWVTGFVLSVIGASVHAFYLRRWKVARPFKLLGLAILVIYLPVAAGVLAATGVIDSIWNIRRLAPDGRTPEEEEKK
ncbi:MAG: YybS family protein [Peptococcaceae bacterium]|nr:YybS family protein [Peptococcaceae bacterium]